MQQLAISNKIRTLSFFATIFVVYRHAFTMVAFLGGHQYASNWDKCIQNSVAAITEVAVPFFFVVSGYFFGKRNYYSHEGYKEMVIKKAKSLMIPFIIWNLCGWLILILSKPCEIVNHSFILQLLNSDFYGPLWYVRDLIVLMMIWPLYGWLLVKTDGWKHFIQVFLLCITLMLSVYCWIPVDCGLLSTEGIVFFTVGLILSRHSRCLELRMPWIYITPLFILWLYFCIDINLWKIEWLHKINTVIGIIVCWNLINCINVNNHKLLSLSKYSFFVYVTHFYVLKSIKVLIAHLFYGNEIVAVITFLLLPLFIVALLIIFGMVCARITPKSFKIITGGRSCNN